MQASDVSYGVVPFENSSYGSVVQTLDLFADRHGEYPDVYVCGEAYLAVNHCLLGHKSTEPGNASLMPVDTDMASPAKPRSQPLASLRHIKHVYSHPQAFGQCGAFLSTFLKGVECTDVSSTSRAAELVAADPTTSTAAISSEVAAEVNGLDVLAKCIQDRDDNTTRFFFLRRGSADLDGPPPRFLHDEQQPAPIWKTLIAFTIDHQAAGALADALIVFKICDLNLTSINSRPSQRRPWHYVFFVECECGGGREMEMALTSALAKLKDLTEGCRWYGSWRSRRGDT